MSEALNRKGRPRATSRRIWSGKVRGHLFGAWYWTRDRRMPGSEHPISEGGMGFERAGLVARVGPLGHVQLSWKEKRWSNGRRRLRTFGVHVWGVSGRRRKRGVEVAVFW